MNSSRDFSVAGYTPANSERVSRPLLMRIFEPKLLASVGPRADASIAPTARCKFCAGYRSERTRQFELHMREKGAVDNDCVDLQTCAGLSERRKREESSGSLQRENANYRRGRCATRTAPIRSFFARL